MGYLERNEPLLDQPDRKATPASSITDRLRSTADGAQAAADLVGAEAAGLAAAQAFRSQLLQGRGGERAPERAAPPGPGAAASADHRPAQ